MTATDDRPVLVTGGAGFIGCNLADRLVTQGHRVRLYDNLARDGVRGNLDWLCERHGGMIEPVIADVRDEAALADAVAGVSGVFHLAAQVAVTTSLADPAADMTVNVGGTLALLEAVRRRAPGAAVIFASTNKVYGDLGDVAFRPGPAGYRPSDDALARHGVAEDRPLDFHTPYGCSKGAADQYVLDYARTFGVKAAVLRMSCIYGEHQFGTEDQGWVAHFLIRALSGEPITIYGDGGQVRDVLYVGDALDAYLRCWRNIDAVAGCAFNLGGGPDNAISLNRLVAHIADLLARPVETRREGWRPADQRWFVADTRAARTALGLEKPRDWREGVARLAHWLAAERGLSIEPALAAAGARR